MFQCRKIEFLEVSIESTSSHFTDIEALAIIFFIEIMQGEKNVEEFLVIKIL